MNLFAKILTTIGSAASLGFGVWHFFVPGMWDWYSHIDPAASELVIAVRAINFFFSLSLVLFGVILLLLSYGRRADDYSIAVVLGATAVLWLSRVVMQIVHPQGSMSAPLQYGMLAAFALVFLCHAVPLVLVLASDDPR